MRAKKVDNVQADIVKALRKAGVSVWVTSSLGDGGPDLVCGVKGGRNGHSHIANYLIEVKSKSGTLTPDQKEFRAEWKGHYAIARSVDDALIICGLAK